jgi:diguanylate cyclase (GGDEF)-like protein
MLLDLDHFKNVNDTWGHPVGDELLKLTSRTMEETKRNSDILIRFGGEEFIVLMPHTSIEGAAAAAEKIRAEIERNSHPVTGVQTVSIGVVERMKSESFRLWYKRTDDALYRAKESGRNRVVVADENENMLMATERL